MNSRDIREHTLKFKLKRIAAKLEISERDLLREAEAIGLFRDAREAAGEVHVTFHGLPSVEEVERAFTNAVLELSKQT